MDLAGLIDSYGYVAVFIGSFLEGETILALAGLAAYRGYLDLSIVIVLAMLAGFLGDQFYFFLGRFNGHKVLARYPRHAARARTASTRCSRAGTRRSSSASASCTASGSWARSCSAWDACPSGSSCSTTSSAPRSGRRWSPASATPSAASLKSALGHLKRYEIYVFGTVLVIGLLFALYHYHRERTLDKEAIRARHK